MHSDAWLPLTALQSVMLVEMLRDPDSDAYWLTLAYRLPAGHSPEQVASAWQAAVAANPVLRTTVELGPDGGRQHVGTLGCALETIDWARTGHACLDDWSRAEIARLKKAGVRSPQRAFLVRAYAAGPGDAPCDVFAWVHHHILADGASQAQCLGDFFHRLRDSAWQPAERPTIAAYLEWSADQRTVAKANYLWTAEAAGMTASRGFDVALAPATAGSAGELRVRDVDFSASAGAVLAAYCREHRLTPASVVTQLWAMILAPYRREADGGLCVGMTFANRPFQVPDADRMSGMLINTLPVRVRVAADGTPEQTLSRACRRTLGSILGIAEHSQVAHSDLVEYAGLPGLAELYDTTVVFENFDGDLVDFGGSADVDAAGARPELLMAAGTSPDPLSLTVDIRGDLVRARLGWDGRRYADHWIKKLTSALEFWLERLGELESEPLDHRSLLTPDDAAELEKALPASAAAPQPWSIGELLDGPDGPDGAALAVVADDRELTYADLSRRSRRLATALAARGVGPGDAVALIGGRGAEAVVALTAVWRLGAAFCPVDGALPQGRREQIVAALRPKAVVPLAELDTVIGDFPETAATAVIAPDQAAYYIATSGTTGIPKLVAVSAGGLSPLVAAWADYYGFEDTAQRVLQIGNWASDVFLGDFLKSAATGGTLVIVPDAERTDLDLLERLATEQRITLLESTPALVCAFLRAVARSGRRPAALRTLIVGAEAFHAAEARQARALLWPGVTLHNGYGLSECTIESVVLPCTQDTEVDHRDPRSGLCPLGRPLPGVAVRIVDRRGRDCPPGAVGELLLGGAGVCLGYLRADGTLDRSRITEHDGVRYFRTGDLVRLADDGVIEFYGRSDNQVKVRGHRVELGEVANALLALPGVADAGVCVLGTGTAAELMAFVVPEPGPTRNAEADTALDAGKLTEALRLVLPAAAIPAVHPVGRLPRNPNGKLDRAGLEALAARIRSAAAEAVATAARADPVTHQGSNTAGELSTRIAAIWRQVADRRVDTARSLFDQGANSLLMLRLFERLREELADNAPTMADLFRHPTIELLAAHLARTGQTSGRGA